MNLLELPVEIILQILSCVHKVGHLHALTLVNRNLRELVLPHLYRCPALEQDPWFLLRSIVNNPELATYIQSLEIYLSGLKRDVTTVFKDEELDRAAVTIRSLRLPYESAFFASLSGGNPGTAWALVLALALNLAELSIADGGDSEPHIGSEHLRRFLSEPQGLTHIRGLFDYVKTLHVRGLDFNDDDTLAMSLRRAFTLPLLHTITFWECIFSSYRSLLESDFAALGSTVTELQFLESKCYADDVGILANACKALTSFRCVQVDVLSLDGFDLAEVVDALVPHASTLVDLHLYIPTNVEDDLRNVLSLSLRPFDQLRHLDINIGMLPPQDTEHTTGARISVFPRSIETLTLSYDEHTIAGLDNTDLRDYLNRDVVLPPGLHEVTIVSAHPWSVAYAKLDWESLQLSRLFEALKRDMGPLGIQVRCSYRDMEHWYMGFSHTESGSSVNKESRAILNVPMPFV